MQMNVECDCGSVRGTIESKHLKGYRTICLCDDCQAYAHYIQRADVLDVNGGTDIIPVMSSHYTFQAGTEKLKCVRLTDKGMFRWYASCCNSPMGNSMNSMSKLVSNFQNFVLTFSLNKNVILLFRIFSLIYLLSVCTNVFADDKDILAGTAAGLTATLKGTGKTYLYIAEGVLSLAAYIKTKNLLFLAGIVVVATFFNIMLTVAGIA